MKICSKLAVVAACGMLAACAARADELSGLKAQVEAFEAQVASLRQKLQRLTEKVQQQTAKPPAVAPSSNPDVWPDIVTGAIGSGAGFHGPDSLPFRLLFQTEAQFDADATSAQRDQRHSKRDAGR